MSTGRITTDHLREAGVGAFFRLRDVAPLGVSYSVLRRLVTHGEVQKVGAGLYRLSDADPVELETVAMVASALPTSIVCLLSALTVHNIGTQAPHEVWIALDRKARKPTRLPAQARIVRFSGSMLTYGIKTQPILGVPVRLTSPARTVVDCFRYRNKIGLDVALEALRDAIRSHRATVDEITRAAGVCRARTVIRPYLEGMTA